RRAAQRNVTQHSKHRGTGRTFQQLVGKATQTLDRRNERLRLQSMCVSCERTHTKTCKPPSANSTRPAAPKTAACPPSLPPSAPCTAACRAPSTYACAKDKHSRQKRKGGRK